MPRAAFPWAEAPALVRGPGDPCPVLGKGDLVLATGAAATPSGGWGALQAPDGP